MVERVKSKEKEAYALELILLLNPGEAKTESDRTKARKAIEPKQAKYCFVCHGNVYLYVHC